MINRYAGFFLLEVLVWLTLSQRGFEWLGGSSESNAMGIYGQPGVFDASSWPGARKLPGALLINDGKEILYFGGRGYQKDDDDRYLNEMWRYRHDDNTWMFVSGWIGGEDPQGGTFGQTGVYNSSNHVTALQGMVFLKIPQSYDEFLIFGGNGKEVWNEAVLNFGKRDDLFTYNITSDQYRFIKGSRDDDQYGQFLVMNQYNSTNQVGGRWKSLGFFINDLEMITMFGQGRDFKSVAVAINLATIWSYHLIKNEWKYVKGNNSADPDFWYGETGVYSPENSPGNLFPSGGWKFGNEIVFLVSAAYREDGGDLLSELWKYNISSSQFKFVHGLKNTEQVPSSFLQFDEYDEENVVGGRTDACSFGIEGELMVLGGRGIDVHSRLGYYGDIFQYSLELSSWKAVHPRSSEDFHTTYVDMSGSFFQLGYHSQNVISSRQEMRCIPVVSENGETRVIVFGGYGLPTNEIGYLNDVWSILWGIPICFGLRFDDSQVCSSSGSCVGDNNCTCLDGAFGEQCALSECYGIISNDNTSCNGLGYCYGTDLCACYSVFTYANDDCSENVELKTFLDNLYLIVLTPVIVLVALCILLCSIVVFFTVVGKLRRRLKKFDQIEDVDLILAEQSVANDKNIAHLKVNKELFVISYSDLNVQKKIGEGGGGAIIYLSKWESQTVCFKCFRINDYFEDDKYKEFEREVEILCSVNFPYILKFYGAVLDDNRIGFVMEYCPCGDLKNFLQDTKRESGVSVSLPEKLRILIEIASSCAYLHSRKIIHRDIKLENVLVAKDESTRLMDFGISKLNALMDTTKTVRVGTRAPEVVSGKYDFKCDVYSWTMMMYIILTENYSPYGKTSEFGIEVKVSQNPKMRPDLEFKLPKEYATLKKMMEKNWRHSPTERDSMKQITQQLTNLLRQLGETKIASSEKEVKKNWKAMYDELKVDYSKLEKTVKKLEKRIKRLKK